jgi:hypothetical protein
MLGYLQGIEMNTAKLGVDGSRETDFSINIHFCCGPTMFEGSLALLMSPGSEKHSTSS